MSEIKWTKDQLAAIEARGAKVLVNAAAGSGKTAVLTTRIIKRLIPEKGEKPVRADRLLVVTFTKAAAGEMRERIEAGLKQALKSVAEDGDMKKRRLISNQIKQLQGAKICTIDSFCQSLIKEYFHILNIDPSFRIAQKTEEREMAQEVFDRLSEQLYREKDRSFMLLATKCTKSGREDMLRDLINEICNFVANIPYQTEFIEKSAEEYLVKSGFFNSAWCEKLKEEQNERLTLAAEALLSLENETLDFSEEIEKINRIKALSFEESLELVRNFSIKIPDAENAKLLTDIIEQVRESANDIPDDLSQCEDALREIFYPEIRALADVTIRYTQELWEIKRSKAVFTFSDIERLAYRLLYENESVRIEQRERFDEILIDEYQDTNELQDGLFEMITNGNNLFMVGDMKQSIYRFRGSEPLVFRRKADTYQYDAASPMRKITLSKNYRSRDEVLQSVNDLFKSCMSRVVGELDYDEAEQLNLGNDGFLDTNFFYKSEFALIELDASADDSLGRVDAEAEYIARRIIEMKRDGFLVRDKEAVRPVKNSDFVILMSSHKTEGEVFTEIFDKYGINCVCTKEGYFDKAEIKLIMSLLAVLDNPERDIPMVALMRSFIGGFSDDEIARIRINGRDISFYESLSDICGKYGMLKEKGELTPSGDIFGEKIAVFLTKINAWRDKARYMSCQRLVNVLFEEAGFYAFYAGDEDGGAVENLQLFFDKAKQFESSGYRGIFTFLRHMQKLADGSEDLEGAASNGDVDAVRIMTIHKSKGLEFPIVFLAGCGKRFVTNDARGSLLMHQRLGMSMDYTDYNDAVLISSPVRGIFEGTIKNELLSEEMRKLYVALTRAKEKVIATGGIKRTSKTDEKLAKWEQLGECGIKNEAKNASGFIDWLAPVAMTADSWKFEYITDITASDAISREEQIKEIHLPDIERMREILAYRYPYEAKSLKSKAAVSDFKGISHTDLQEKPKFLADKRISGADFGTAVHKIMETLPRDKGNEKAFVEAHIKGLMNNGDISDGVADFVGAEKIMRFFASDIGRRFAEAKNVYTESEFEIEMAASELYGGGEYQDEKILLQGIIDCWFEEEDGIVLVDYKTDRVNNLDEIHQKYDIQLNLYALALEKIAKKRVKEKFIYLFSKDCVVQC